MDVALPSSRAPRALRGDTLRVALRELGSDAEAPVSRTTETRVRAALPLPVAAPEPVADDDDPAPAALRPDELARWLDGRG